MMLDHLRVLRLSCRHHGGLRQCGGRGERAEVVIHLESVVSPLVNSPIFALFSAQIRCAEVVNGMSQFRGRCAPGHMVSPSILPMSLELYLEVDDILLGVGGDSGPLCVLCPLRSHASIRRSWGHHLLGEHEGRGHGYVMHSAHVTREPRKLTRDDGCKFGGGARGGGGSTFSISSFASSLCCADEGSPLQKIKTLCKIFSPPRQPV